MKRVAILALLLLALTACKKDIHLRALPALTGGGNADVRVELTYDRNNKLTVVVSGVQPSDQHFVVWTKPADGDAVNVGQIRIEAGKGKLETLTPLRKFTVMITLEAQGDARKPSANVVFQGDKEIEW